MFIHKTHKMKPTISISKGMLIIQDSSHITQLVLSIDQAKELLRLLPSLISLLEPIHSGNSEFKLGELP